MRLKDKMRLTGYGITGLAVYHAPTVNAAVFSALVLPLTSEGFVSTVTDDSYVVDKAPYIMDQVLWLSVQSCVLGFTAGLLSFL